jgi:cytochrome c biogenesis protein CcmG/thiol:disulfide interchange protein DsbE
MEPSPRTLPTQETPLLVRLLQLAAVALVAALLALLVWKVVDAGRGSTLVSDIRAGRNPQAPQFRLPVIWPAAATEPHDLATAFARGRLSLSQLRGYPAVINFWASWCIPCRDEAPRLAASARAHAGKVSFIGIDVQDFSSDARRFLRRHVVPYASLKDEGGNTYDAYGLTGVPETYYLDASGRILAHSPGAVSQAELEQGIDTITGNG